MCRRSVLLISSLGCALAAGRVTPLMAQDTLATGTHVRVRYVVQPTSAERVAVGTLAYQAHDTLAIRVGRTPTVLLVPRAQLRRLEVRTVPAPAGGRWFLPLAAAVGGGYVGYSDVAGESAGKRAAQTTMGIALGALVGELFARTVFAERWRVVAP
jgi:hypothetical protein